MNRKTQNHLCVQTFDCHIFGSSSVDGLCILPSTFCRIDSCLKKYGQIKNVDLGSWFKGLSKELNEKVNYEIKLENYKKKRTKEGKTDSNTNQPTN